MIFLPTTMHEEPEMEDSPYKKLSELLGGLSDWISEKGHSDSTQAQRRNVARFMEDDKKSWKDLPEVLAQNPMGAGTQGVESILSMLVPAGAGVAAAKGAGAMGKALKMAVSPEKAMTAGVIGGNTLMNAADTFDATADQSLEDRYKGAGVSAAASLLASALTGGAAEKTLASLISGQVAKNAAAGGSAAALKEVGKQIGKGAVKEGLQETGEEAGNSIGEDVARGQDIDLQKAGRRGAFGGVLGAAMGGGVGGLNAGASLRGVRDATAEASPASAEKAAAEAVQRIDALAAKSASAPVPVTQAEDKNRMKIQAPDFENETEGRTVLQNRDRSLPQSVGQMNSIAAAPDYIRLRASNDLGNGAPVVAYGTVPEAQLGRQEVVADNTGKHYQMRYAVVDADTVLTSNDVGGAVNPAYQTAPETEMRAIAGNGRIAGLTAAYQRGSAGQYRADLTADASSLGIDPKVVEGMKQPILVRVMEKSDVTADIGDRSNTAGNMALSAAEQAANDVDRIDFGKISFTPDGEVDNDSVLDFAAQMPEAERNTLVDRNNKPTAQGYARFASALFKKAYGDDELVRIAVQSNNEEISTIFKAMRAIAPKMARLAGLGNLDIRGLVTQAAQMAINAKRSGVALKDYIAQDDMTVDPDVLVIAEVFAANSRSYRQIAEILENAADFAYSEGVKPAEDMFGPIEKATRQDVLNRIREQTHGQQSESTGNATGAAAQQQARDDGSGTTSVEERGRAEPAEENVQRPSDRAATGSDGQADARTTEESTLSLVGETEEEARQNNERRAAFEEEERTAADRAEREAREERLAKDTRAAVEKSVDRFELNDDTVSDEDAVSGQQGLKFSRGSDTVEAVTRELESNEKVGDAFRELRRIGAVEVVETVDDLPSDIQGQLDESKMSRSAMKSVEANIRRGKNSMAKALLNRSSVFRAMYRNGLGWVDFLWGYEGSPKVTPKGSRKGERGLLHILEARWRKDGYSEKQVSDLLDDIVETIARGKAVKDGDYKQVITHSGVTVVLVKNRPYNNWLLSGYRNETTGDTVPAFDVHGATDSRPTPGRTRGGAVADSYETILGATVLTVKRSEDGSIQGVFDPASGKSWLIASNLTPETAPGVLVHEVGVHMAADGSGRAAMEPLIARAAQIVINGASNGDATAKAVLQRMEDAGLVETVGGRKNIKKSQEEEAFAYLAEHVVNNKEKSSRPIREWFEKVIRAIRLWLYHRGLFVQAGNLREKELVDLAIANVRELGREKRAGTSGLKFSKSGTSSGEESPVTQVLSHRLDTGTPAWGFKRSGKIVGRDNLGRMTFAPGEWAYANVARAAHTLFDLIDEKSGHRFNLNPLSPEFRMQYRRYKAELQQATDAVGEVATALSQMPEAERRLVSDIVEKTVAPGVNPPEHVVQVAAAVSNLMDTQTDQMLAEGLLTQESADRWRGEYLPRVYLKQTELLKDAKQSFDKLFGRKSAKGIRGNSFKGRGIFRQVVGEQDIANHKALGWEVRDPDWSDAQGFLDFTGTGQRPKVPEVIMWRDFTQQERALMGEERDAMVRLVLGYMDSQKDIALFRFFAGIAENPEFAGKIAQDGWVKIPDTTIGDGSKVKRYGKLAGLYVAPEVWSQISHYGEPETTFTRLWHSFMSAWKEGKTALNPVAHLNNTVGNIAMAHFAGVNAWDAPTYFKTVESIYKQDATYQEAVKAGLLSGSFMRNEVLELLPLDDVREKLTGMKPAYEKVFDLFLTVFSLGFRRSLRAAYEFEDAFFKLLIYRKGRSEGLTPEQAVDLANQYIFAYDDLPSGARAVRDSILPFFSWTYKAIPVLLRTAMVYPHRFLLPAAICFAFNKAAYLSAAVAAGADDDDWEKIWKRAQEMETAERSLLPESSQGFSIFATPKFIRTWTNSDGTPNFLDASRLVPGGDMLDANNQMGGVPWLQPLMPNSPTIGLFLSIFANKDAFTGRDIVGRTDDAGEASMKRLGYVWRNIAPALAPGSYHFNRLANGVASATGTSFTLDPFFDYTGTDWQGRNMEMSRALINTLGIKMRAVDLEQEAGRKAGQARGEIRELQGQIRSKARARAKGCVSDEAFESFVGHTVDNIAERVKKLNEISDNLEKLKKVNEK
ncbi:hypothetical protein [Duodenibacillus massiliensis]|uniref:putative barnase/colicin E5 family endoribonuclease n=1 Tax=Duodenibacillus massiliensis TaxID=1852381 RepID=UPI00307B46E5